MIESAEPTAPAMHTPGPWILTNAPSEGNIIKARIPFHPYAGKLPPPENIFHVDPQRLYDIFHLPSIANVSIHLNANGECWGTLAYEDWVQFPSQDWKEMQAANARVIAEAPEVLAHRDKLLEACKALCDTTYGNSSEDSNLYICPFCGAEWSRKFDGGGMLIFETIEHDEGCAWVAGQAAIADAKEKP